MTHFAPLLTLAAGLAAAFGYGALWLRLLRVGPPWRALRCVQAVALGLGTLAYLILAAGLLGWWRPAVFAGLLAFGAVAALCEATACWALGRLLRAPGAYGGRIPREGDLHPEERWAEATFARWMLASPQRAIQAYRARFGNEVSTDLARELFPGYARSPEARTRLARPTYQPARWLAREVLRHVLNADSASGTLVLTAGGPGSGKTSALRGVGETSSLMEEASLVLDSSLSDFDEAREIIRSALGAGWSVVVLYVHCPVERAAVRALHRGLLDGRPVSVDRLAELHVRAQRCLNRLTREFGSAIEVFVIANRGEPQDVGLADPAFLLREGYADEEEATRRARSVLETEIQTRAAAGCPVPAEYRGAILGRGECGGTAGSAGDAESARESGSVRGGESRRGTPGQGIASLALAVFLGLAAVLTLLSALEPVDGLDWDSLSYHLAAPAIWLREGRITFLAYDHHTHFPFTLEMLYALGLSFGGAPGAKLFHWAAGWLTAAGVGLLADRLAGEAGRPRWVGPLAAALFAAMPLVLWEMGTAYIDLGTALFQLLALAALLEGVRREGGRWRLDPTAAVLAGAFSGLALGTKYTALLQFGLLGVGLLCLTARAGPGRAALFRSVLTFGLVGVLVASPWYLKNWLWVRNPVYPFFYSLFPGSFSWGPREAAAYAGEQAAFGLPRTPENLLKALWNLGLNGREFFVNGKLPVGDVLGSLGPAWAGLLPLALFARRLGPGAVALLLYGFASLAVWFVLSQQVRYLMPVFAPLAVAGALIVAALPARPARVGAGAFAGLCLAGGLWLHLPLAESALPVVTGQVSEAEFLERNHPDLHEAAQWVNTLPESVKVALYSETRGYFFERDYLWANPGHHRLIPYDRLRTGADLAGALAGMGVTHVLINYSFSRDQGATGWYRLLLDGIQTGVLEQEFATARAEFGRRGIIIYSIRGTRDAPREGPAGRRTEEAGE